MKKPSAMAALFEGVRGELAAGATGEQVGVEAKPSSPAENLLLRRESTLKDAAEGRRITRVQRKIAPSRCRMWERHNRRYDLLDEVSCADLIEGFKAKGKQEFAAIVRPLEGVDGVEFEVICGARRHWTATYLKWDLLVEIRELSDEEAFVLSDLENRDRQDISDYERAVDYRDALGLYYDGNKSRMAEHIGIDRTYLGRLLDVADLPEYILEAVVDVRQIRVAYVRELKAVTQNPKMREADQIIARDAVLEKSRALKEEGPQEAGVVFKELIAAAKQLKVRSAAAPRARSITSYVAKGSGKVALEAKRRKGALVMTIPGGSGATTDELLDQMRVLLDQHNRN
jgi:ParB family chromosome partitioning protein